MNLYPTPSKNMSDKSFFVDQKDTISFFLIATVATASMLKRRGYSWALRFYPSGGGGLNLYRFCEERGKNLRRFALDYHPIWNKETQSSEYRLHYHRGPNASQMKKHRPHQGGW